MDITDLFIQASRSGIPWDEARAWQAFEAIQSAIPNSVIDWYPGSGETWGRLVYERHCVVHIHRTTPIAFVNILYQELCREILSEYKLQQIAYDDYEAEIFELDIVRLNNEMPEFGWDATLYTNDEGPYSVNSIIFDTIIP